MIAFIGRDTQHASRALAAAPAASSPISSPISSPLYTSTAAAAGTRRAARDGEGGMHVMWCVYMYVCVHTTVTFSNDSFYSHPLPFSPVPGPPPITACFPALSFARSLSPGSPLTPSIPLHAHPRLLTNFFPFFPFNATTSPLPSFISPVILSRGERE